MILLTQYYKSKSSRRQSELAYSLVTNASNPVFERVVVFHDEVISTRPFSFMDFIKTDGRLTYQQVFKFAQTFNDVCVLANADIIFDGTLHMASQVKEGEIIAVTRCELNPTTHKSKPLRSRTYFHDGQKVQVTPEQSQDVWIFRSPFPEFEADVQMGTLHCDLKMVKATQHAGIPISNGYKHINAIHVHWSEYRAYEGLSYDNDKCEKLTKVWEPSETSAEKT